MMKKRWPSLQGGLFSFKKYQKPEKKKNFTIVNFISQENFINAVFSKIGIQYSLAVIVVRAFS